MALIDAHRDRWGVEPICQVLEVAPSTYYAATSRPTSSRRLRDEELKVEIERVHKENFEVYGIEKVWRQLNREGVRVGRDRVARLMRELNLEGAVRGKRKRTTVAGELEERPSDLVDRNFRAPAPNRLWVADLSYVSTWSGFVYVAFILDAFSRSVVGWRVSDSLCAELALDALEMALWARGNQELEGLVHHSDRGGQPGLFATRSAWPRPAPFARSAPAVTATTTPWPRPWSASTRPSSSADVGPGGPASTSSWPPPSGWTGSDMRVSCRSLCRTASPCVAGHPHIRTYVPEGRRSKITHISGTSVGSTAPSTTYLRPSSSVGGGSARRPRLPDVLTFPAPPSRRLGGEMTSVSGNPQAPVSVLPSLAASRRAAAPLKEDLPLPLPSSARANRWRANPSRRASKKPRAIQPRRGAGEGD